MEYLNLNIKLTRILHNSFLLFDWFRFCNTHFTTYQFVADQSAISPLLGGAKFGLTRIYSQLPVSNLDEWRHICYFFRWQKISRVTFVTFLGRMWGSFQTGIFPEPGPRLEWGTVTKWCNVTFLSHFVTFQVRCDAARFRTSFFQYFQKCDDFPGTVQVWRFCHIDIIFFVLQSKQSFKTLPGPGFWVPGFLILAWNDPVALAHENIFFTCDVFCHILPSTLYIFSLSVQNFFEREEICWFGSAQGWKNRTPIIHERVDSRFLVLPGSKSTGGKPTSCGSW